MKNYKKDMAKELEKYKEHTYLLCGGRLIQIYVSDLNDYNHIGYELHHYIPFHKYEPNKQWYIDRGIQQKLILIKKTTHEQVENRATKNMTDEQFLTRYGISRWDLVFNRRYSNYDDNLQSNK